MDTEQLLSDEPGILPTALPSPHACTAFCGTTQTSHTEQQQDITVTVTLIFFWPWLFESQKKKRLKAKTELFVHAGKKERSVGMYSQKAFREGYQREWLGETHLLRLMFLAEHAVVLFEVSGSGGRSSVSGRGCSPRAAQHAGTGTCSCLHPLPGCPAGQEPHLSSPWKNSWEFMRQWEYIKGFISDWKH